MRLILILLATIIIKLPVLGQTKVSIDTSMFLQHENVHEAKIVISSVTNGQPFRIPTYSKEKKLFAIPDTATYMYLVFCTNKYRGKNGFFAVFNKRQDGTLYLQSIEPKTSLVDLLEYVTAEYLKFYTKTNHLTNKTTQQ